MNNKNIFALFFGLIVSLVILELYFQFFYPFPSVIKRGEIYLPANASKIIKIRDTPGLSNEVVFSTNAIGLRGPNPPPDPENYLSIITLGGSTTEDHYQNDGKTWTHLLGQKLQNEFRNAWVNNAGKDGLSTYGLMYMLEDHVVKLKPKIAIFSVSVNDVGLQFFNKFDLRLADDQKLSYEPRFGRWSKSGIVTFIDNMMRAYAAKKTGVTHEFGDFFDKEHVVMNAEQRDSVVAGMAESVSEFKNRVKWLVKTARAHGVEPILITEPTLLGDAVDETSGVDLGTLKYGDMNGSVHWAVLQLYHQALKQVGSEDLVFVIDMGAKMPKDSLYFYDAHHYTDAGAALFADLLFEALAPHLGEQYADFKK